MGVEQLGVPNEGLGYQESMDAFRQSHKSNSDQLLNIAEGRKKTDPRPVYDPNSPDNQWPVMVHRADGTLTVGRSLKGIEDPRDRARIQKENEAGLALAKKEGYRMEPFLKPQIAVLDPAAEKAELLRKNNELQAQINALADQVSKLVNPPAPAA